jgi:HPt (histidine-containing phosphotransfer) domain-containing protein
MTHAPNDTLDTLPVFDADALREVTDMANIKPADLIDIFLTELDKNLPLLRNALQDEHGNALSVERFAHSLKSSAVNVGAMRVAAFARQLEATAPTLAHAELLLQLDRLSGELERYRRIALA